MTNITAPPHHDLSDSNWSKKGDSAGYFPTVESAQAYADGVKAADYHQDRLRALQYLLEPLFEFSTTTNEKHLLKDKSLTVLDFGIGDGGIVFKLNIASKKVIGIDVSPHLLAIASKKLSAFEFEGHCGSVEALKKVKTEDVDLALCLNTLGYLSDNDQQFFFKEMSRVIRRGGYLAVMTGNELFDLFALNSGTVGFFKKHFNQPDVSMLLLESNSERFKNADRRNPLSFPHELQQYGFREIRQAFSQWHRKLPPLANKEFNGDLLAAHAASRDHDFDPNVAPLMEKWKSYFLCSMFASLSQKV